MRATRVSQVALVLGGVGCATVQPVREPAQFVSQNQPAVVYVMFKNHARVTFTSPRVSGDSLVGTVPGAARTLGAPLSHIQRIEARQHDRMRTNWLIAGVALAATAAVLGIRASGSGKACDVSLAGTYSDDPLGPTGEPCY